MIAPCGHNSFKKSGKNRNGSQRYKCKDCGTRFSGDAPVKPLDGMRIDLAKAEMVLSMLLEGMSIRSVERLTNLHRDTICDLVLVAGKKCHEFMRTNIANVKVNDLQIDELWSFVGMKQKQANARDRGDDETVGDSYTFFAIERDTKLILAYHVGRRDENHTDRFLAKVRRAVDLDHRFQVTTDGLSTYTYGVPFGLGRNIDFAQLVKKYESSQEETRYSPAKIISAEKVERFGEPDSDRVCTSHVERANLTVRMQLRRFTRLTNGFSKSIKHHAAMQAIFFAWYNFCRKHSTIGKTPATEAGLTFRPLKMVELLSR